MAVELRADPVTRSGVIARVAEQLGMGPETLRNWVRQAEIDGGVRPGTTTSDAQRLVELERENRELRRANPVMRPKGGWKSVTDVEIAVAEYVDWFNHRRLHGEIGLVPPAEFETAHCASITPKTSPETPVPAGAGSTYQASTKPGAIHGSRTAPI